MSDLELRRLSREILRCGQSPFVALITPASPTAEAEKLVKVTLVRKNGPFLIRENYYACQVALFSDVVNMPYVRYVYDLDRRRALPLGCKLKDPVELEDGWTETNLTPSSKPLGKLYGK